MKTLNTVALALTATVCAKYGTCDCTTEELPLDTPAKTVVQALPNCYAKSPEWYRAPRYEDQRAQALSALKQSTSTTEQAER